MDFFLFDNQIRRYLLQFMRIFSDIKVRLGPDSAGLYTIQRVPIMYGDPSTMVAHLIKGASENTVLPNPMFSVYIDSIQLSPNRRQDTQFVGKISTIERSFDSVADTYSNTPGVRQDIERYMPVPYDLFVKLDAWTPNINIKLQLFEQIGIIFNPSIQLQQNSNMLDWTSIFEVFLNDYTFTNRSIPQGSDETRDIMSYKFKIPIWINPPAKVKRSSLIAEIVSNVFYNNDIEQIKNKIDGKFYDPFRSGCISGIPTQIITTEGNYSVKVQKNNGVDNVVLLKNNSKDPARWEDLIQAYGQITPDITKIRLKIEKNVDSDSGDIIGNIYQDPDREDILLLTIDQDTMPSNTIPYINDIIDPVISFPGKDLPVAVAGQRYLIISSTALSGDVVIPPGVPTSPWGDNIVAHVNDVIEFNGLSWSVIFSAKDATEKAYVTNSANSTQYTYDPVDHEWTYTYYGQYGPGMWRIDNIITPVQSYE